MSEFIYILYSSILYQYVLSSFFANWCVILFGVGSIDCIHCVHLNHFWLSSFHINCILLCATEFRFWWKTGSKLSLFYGMGLNLTNACAVHLCNCIYGEYFYWFLWLLSSYISADDTGWGKAVSMTQDIQLTWPFPFNAYLYQGKFTFFRGYLKIDYNCDGLITALLLWCPNYNSVCDQLKLMFAKGFLVRSTRCWQILFSL